MLTTALGDPVGIQLGYTDPQGRKSVMHANSVLVAHGPEELRRLVTEAEPGQLSFEGELTRLFERVPQNTNESASRRQRNTERARLLHR